MRQLFVLVMFAILTLAGQSQDVKTKPDDKSAFEHSSGIQLNELSETQVDNLATLGKVWGFLKYHHPKVASGELQWDFELFRVLRSVIKASNHTEANGAISQWIEGLGPLTACKRCANLNDKDLYLHPALEWISNKLLLGQDLSQQLEAIYANRPANGKQFYVSLAPQVGNPVFDHELSYDSVTFPDSGYQLLALYRYWNIVQYWAPNRDLVEGNWNSVLTEFIPRVALVKDREAYELALFALISRAHDGHSNLWNANAIAARPPAGDCRVDATLRFAENQPVIAGFPDTGAVDGLAVGDIITEIDGVSVSKLISDWKPYYSSSTEAAQLRDISRYMTRGKCGEMKIGIHRGSENLMLTVHRVPFKPANSPGTHDLPGPTFRLLSKDVAYLKLSSVKMADVPKYLQGAAGAKGLIIDIRNYPSEFMVFALGQHLVDRRIPFVRFTDMDLANPGAILWGPMGSLTPESPHYQGKVVILIDEVSQSQAEYTAMAFRSASGTVVVGSTTAGADGNVSPFPLPGGLRTMITGLGVFYPDKSPTQRIGIVPDIQIKLTVAAIRAGRDEVLEQGLREILGRQTPQAEIEKLYK